MDEILNNLKYLFQLYWQPQKAMSRIMDGGSWIFGAIGVLILAAVFQFTINDKILQAYNPPRFDFEQYRELNFAPNLPNDVQLDEDEADKAEYAAAYRNYQKAMQTRQKFPVIGNYGLWLFSASRWNFLAVLFSLMIFYVPATILCLTFVAPIGSFSRLLGSDYGSLLACTLMAWAAAHLPFALAGILLYSQALSPLVYLGMWFLSVIYFGFLMILALRTVFGAEFGSAVLTIGGAWIFAVLGTKIFAFISPWLFSPFLLFYGYMYFRGGVSEMNGSFRQRQNFKRFLQNSLVNPKDSDAHVQLGLIYKQRRQIDKARQHFEKAVAIDAAEIDANYELGKLARERGEFQKAIDYFSIVVEQNEKYALSEIWREIGVTYFVADMLNEAQNALATFVERRPFDTEGLYYYGKTLKALGKPEEAREMFRRCVEAMQTAPDYRKYDQRKWGILAKKELSAN